MATFRKYENIDANPRTLTLKESLEALKKWIADYSNSKEYAVQECYNECILVECGEGPCAKAIADKFPFITRTK